jgi:site-specific DNA-cytosine methylase
VIESAKPSWFLRENVPKAPDIKPKGYEVTNFLLDNCWLGEAQMRKRRFWFGWPQERGPAPNLWKWIETATFELPDASPAVDGGHGAAPWTREKLALTQAVSADSRTVPVRLGGSGKVKVTADGGHDGSIDAIGLNRKKKKAKVPPVTGRHHSNFLTDDAENLQKYPQPHRKLGEMLELQGLPPDFLDEAPFTMHAKRKLVGNAVPLPMARAIAKAVKEAIQ